MKYFNIVLFLCGIYSFLSCTDEDNIVPFLIEKDGNNFFDGINFLSEKGERKIVFETNMDWSIVSNMKWCEVEPCTGGKGINTVLIKVDKNTTYDDRTANIILTSGEIEQKIVVNQLKLNSLILDKTSYELGYKREVIDVVVNSNIAYEVFIPKEYQNWIHRCDTRGLTSSTMRFIVDENIEYVKREGKILFLNDSISTELNICQKGTGIVTIEEKNGGTLNNILLNYNTSEITHLKVEGVMNNDDLGAINSLQNLQVLDISNVDFPKIVRGVTKVNKIKLPSSLVEIGEEAFEDCSFDTIFIPKSVEVIGNRAFLDCKNLRKVIFEEGSKLSKIEGGWYSRISDATGVFDNCINLEEINIPANVKVIKGGAFHNCLKLKNVFFCKNSTLEEIEGEYIYREYRGAFADCNSLVSINLPKSLKKIGPCAFRGCQKMKSVNFESGSLLNEISGGYTADQESGFGAFFNCSSLTEITIPSNVESISSSAFQRCYSLKKVNFEKPSKLRYIAGGTGGGLSSYDILNYFGAFADCSSLESIDIPASVEIISETAFKNCRNLKSVSFEPQSSLKKIEGSYIENKGVVAYYGVFSGCSSLKEINIPASVEIIESTAFKGCSSLEKVTFETKSKLQFIEGDNNGTEQGAFYSCKNLTNFDASNCTMLKEIGESTFYGNVNLSLFQLGTALPPTVGKRAFQGIDDNAILKVPAEAINNYLNSNWNLFFDEINSLK